MSMQFHPENTWILYLIIAGFGMLGIIFLGIGIGIYWQNKRKQKTCTQQVTATVADIKRETMLDTWNSNSDPSSSSWFPVYEYSINGKTYRKKAFVGTKKPEVAVGDPVLILINPCNSEEFYCPKEKRLLVAKVFLSVGSGLVCTAILITVFFRKWIS